MKSLNWKSVEGTQEEQPLELETTSRGVVLRKDITQTEKETEEGKVTYWTYQEVRMTTEEYAEYLGDLQAPSVLEIMQLLSDVQAEQEMANVTRDLNTETVMQAISDLQADIALL